MQAIPFVAALTTSDFVLCEQHIWDPVFDLERAQETEQWVYRTA